MLDGTVTVGVGFTVMVYVFAVPGQPFTVGVTVMVALIAAAVVLVALKPVMFPVPEAPNPMAVLLFDQAKVPPVGVLAKAVVATAPPLQTTMLEGTVTVGVTRIVTVAILVSVQVPVPTV